MDAALVRSFVASLEDRPPDAGTLPRLRAGLEILGRPDVRYLVGLVRGPGAETVVRYARGVLECAGAPTATPSDELDDPLLERAGTIVAGVVYQLAATDPARGEPSRIEIATLIALAAAAEASRRVVLLADPDADPAAPSLAVASDLVALVRLDGDRLAAAVADVPDGRPVVALAAEPDRPRLDELARGRGLPLVLAGREFDLTAAAGAFDLRVGDERYAALAIAPGDDPWLAGTGIVTALGLAALGVRMRPEWVEAGARRAAGRE